MAKIITQIGMAIGKAFLFLVVLLLLILWPTFQEGKRLSVFFNCKDLSELRMKYGEEIKSEERIVKDGEFYTLVYLKFGKNVMYLPSGPPVMVFNRRGEKVVVCADSGDSPTFYNEWCRAQKVPDSK